MILVMISTYDEKAKPFDITISMAPVSDHWTPHCSVILHLGTEVAKDDQFVPWCNRGDEVIQLSVELVFHGFIRVKSWHVNWVSVRKLLGGREMWSDIRHSLMALWRRLWPCIIDVLITNPTPCIQRSGAGFSFQKMKYLDPLLSILLSSIMLVSLRVATSMLKCAASTLQMFKPCTIMKTKKRSNVPCTKNHGRVAEIIEKFWSTTKNGHGFLARWRWWYPLFSLSFIGASPIGVDSPATDAEPHVRVAVIFPACSYMQFED